MTDLPENKTATTINTGIRVTGNAIVTLVENMIVADVPALGLPIIKQLWQALFTWVAGYFIKAAENGATFEVIDVQVEHEETIISEALAAVVAAEKSGDANALKKAIKDYADAQTALVHDDGSSTAS